MQSHKATDVLTCAAQGRLQSRSLTERAGREGEDNGQAVDEALATHIPKQVANGLHRQLSDINAVPQGDERTH